MLFWIDRDKGCIHKASRDGSHKDIIIKELSSPQRLSIDSISKRIYWTDDKTSTIEMADFEGNQRYVVVSDSLQKPFAVAVDALSGYLFWSDNGPSPTIEQSGLDGMDRVVIVSTHLKWVTGLAIDSEGKRLFWCDSNAKTLNMVKYDGSMRRSLLHANSGIILAPYSLVFVDRFLYWLDLRAHGGSIARLDTRGQAKIEVIRKDVDRQSSTLKDIKFYNSNLHYQDKRNICSKDNGGGGKPCHSPGWTGGQVRRCQH